MTLPQRVLDWRAGPARIVGGRAVYCLKDDQRPLIVESWQAVGASLDEAPAKFGCGAVPLLYFRADRPFFGGDHQAAGTAEGKTIL